MKLNWASEACCAGKLSEGANEILGAGAVGWTGSFWNRNGGVRARLRVASVGGRGGTVAADEGGGAVG